MTDESLPHDVVPRDGSDVMALQGDAVVAYAPATPAVAIGGPAPRIAVAGTSRPGPDASPADGGVDGAFAGSRDRSVASRARPPLGRWPPAISRTGVRPPYDLDDPALARVRARPRPELWDPDEPATLHEVVTLLFPDGPITVATLRTARRQGQLGTAKVAGRIYTTVGAVRAMTRPSLGPPRPAGDAADPA